jgi:hypothetical protein
MYLRIFSAAVLLALAGCSQKKGEDGQTAEAEATKEMVPCAFGGAKEFNAKCTVDRSIAEGKNYITVRHPDGGFRRLEVLDGGKRYASADGADAVEGGPNGAEVEVMVGDDHYLMPSNIPKDANAAAR